MESKHAWFVCISPYRTSMILLIAKILYQLRLVTGSISHSLRSVFYTSQRSVGAWPEGILSQQLHGRAEISQMTLFSKWVTVRSQPKIRKIHCSINPIIPTNHSLRLDKMETYSKCNMRQFLFKSQNYRRLCSSFALNRCASSVAKVSLLSKPIG